jgi:hypothetical protein
MKSTQPGKDEAKSPDRPTQRKQTDRSSADSHGGVPATEEDIGTEGAGTEPPVDVNADRQTGAPSKGDRRKGGA